MEHESQIKKSTRSTSNNFANNFLKMASASIQILKQSSAFFLWNLFQQQQNQWVTYRNIYRAMETSQNIFIEDEMQPGNLKKILSPSNYL